MVQQFETVFIYDTDDKFLACSECLRKSSQKEKKEKWKYHRHQFESKSECLLVTVLPHVQFIPWQ